MRPPADPPRTFPPRSALSEPEVRQALKGHLELLEESVDKRLREVRDRYEERVRKLTQEWEHETAAWEERVRAAEGAVEAFRADYLALEQRCRELADAIAEASRARAAARAAERTEPASPPMTMPVTSIPVTPPQPPPRPPQQARSESAPLALAPGAAQFLADAGLEVIDKRASGGNLWVVGPRDRVAPLLAKLRSRGVNFSYSASGGRTTGGRPGWYTKSKK